MTDEAKRIQRDIEWADRILAMPDSTAINGGRMHEIANEVKEVSLLAAIEVTEYTADGQAVLV